METIKINEKTVQAVSPEGQTASMSLEQLFEAAAPGGMNTRGVILPDGVKLIDSRGPITLWVHETPPRVYGFKWIAKDSPSRFGRGTKYGTVRIALPYLVVVASFEGSTLSGSNECFFRTAPLEDEDDELCYPALLNCSKFTPQEGRPLSWICTANLGPESCMPPRKPKRRMRTGFRALLHCLLETGPVLVLPEPISNSVLISATPAVCGEITRLIEQLDRKPAMVSLELLIAEVTYRDAEESPAGDPPTGAENRPGPPEIVGLPGDSQFSAERLLKELGLDATAGSAPAGDAGVDGPRNQKPRRVEVLSRVQLTASNNQPASIQVGKQEPVIRGSQVSRTGGRINNVTLEHVGLLVNVTPRIAPDGHVTIELKVEESRLGPVDEGVPLASGEGHAEVRMPRTVTTSLETTVTAADGQTVVLGGLITKSASRRVDLVILASPRVVRGGAQ